ncbi:hypothetical protein VPHD148_0062 [Vibrio phage D148]
MIMTEGIIITDHIPYLYVQAKDSEVIINDDILSAGQCVSIHNPISPIEIVGASYILHTS